VPDHIREWSELYGHYDHGFLLHSGGIGDQPEWYLKAMSCFAAAFNKASKERRDNLKKK